MKSTINKNKIIKGDCNSVLPKLHKTLTSKIKCIYIDPPYNKGEVFNHYTDNLPHDQWEASLAKTLKLLKPLLKDDGSLWLSINDQNVHYAKVLCDKIFGRKCFITTIVWQNKTTKENRKLFSVNHEYILVYAPNPKLFSKSANRGLATPEMLARYKNPDNDKRGSWQSVSANVQAGHASKSQFYTITSPCGSFQHTPPKGRCWAYNQERMLKEIKNSNIWFGKEGKGVPRVKKFLEEGVGTTSHETIWTSSECGTNDSAKKHILKLFPHDDVFDTPKPEELLKKIFDIATNKEDIILDCFLGSGTSAAVAHKIKRNYIGIDIGEHLSNLVTKRLDKVITGTDNLGISSLVEWSGGGDYQYLEDKDIY